MKVEKDKYIKELMEKYNMSNQRELHNVITQDEYDKLIKLQLNEVREVNKPGHKEGGSPIITWLIG